MMLFDELNEGAGRDIRKGYKKYVELLSKLKNDFRYAKNGIVVKGLGSLGIEPFKEQQIKSMSDSYRTSKARYYSVKGRGPAEVSVACAIFFEFINKFINAKSLLDIMGFRMEDITSSRISRARARKNIDDILGLYDMGYGTGSIARDKNNNRYNTIRQAYFTQVDSISEVGEKFTASFNKSVSDKIARSGASEKSRQKAEDNLNMEVTKIKAAWNSEMAEMKNQFPTIIKDIIISSAYTEYYSFISTEVVPSMLSALKDNTQGGINTKIETDPIAMAESVKEPLNEGANVKSRGRKCTKTLQKLMKSFKEEENGLQTSDAFGNWLTNLFSKKKQVVMGVRPFIKEQIDDIRKDFDKAKAEFEKDAQDVEKKSISASILYQFFSKYTNAEALLSKSGVQVKDGKIDYQNAYGSLQKLLGAFNPKNATKDGGMENFVLVRDSYNKMLTRFDNLGKGIVQNFIKYTKSGAGENGMSEKEQNNLEMGAQTLISGWERQISIMKNDFSSVMREIMSSDGYTQYYQFVTYSVLPTFANGVTVVPFDSTVLPTNIIITGKPEGGAATGESDLFAEIPLDNSGNAKTVASESAEQGTAPTLNEDDENKGLTVFTDIVKGSDGKVANYKFYEISAPSDVVKEKIKEYADKIESVTQEEGQPDVAKQWYDRYAEIKASGKGSDHIAAVTLDEFIQILQKKGGTPEQQQGEQNGGENNPTPDSSAGQANGQQTQDASAGQANGQPTAPAPEGSSESYKVSYDVPKLLESVNGVSITRKIEKGNRRTKNTICVLSETVWGDGRVLDPQKYLTESYKRICDSCKTYGDIAKVVKNSNTMRIAQIEESVTYQITYPYNGVMGAGNPLYEHVAIIEIDNSENKKVVSKIDTGIHKITF